MKRVMCLYRVSTKGQVDPEDDIPMQRRECLEFISQHKDWKYIGELMEKGVSGYKVSMNKRDAIVQMRAMAEKKEFDILLVFMFDRLGRREDETPFLVQWFIENGIEVWSTREGQQRIDNRADKLINYIRYWQAGGESEKISLRVSAAHSQMTADGIWRGGCCPFGYKLVHNGRIGKKNRPLYDMEIDEVNGPIIQEIFELYTKAGYGALRICNYLNKKYPNINKIWTRASLMTVLRNRIYTGRMHMNNICSDPNEELRLISDEDFETVQDIIKSRFHHRPDDENSVFNADWKVRASLLSGLLYCKHCGARLTGAYSCKRTYYGFYSRPIYRCYNKSIIAKGCSGKTVYTAGPIEKAVVESLSGFFNRIPEEIHSVWNSQSHKDSRTSSAKGLDIAIQNMKKLESQRHALEHEAVESITGSSKYNTDFLLKLISENNMALIKAKAEVERLQKDCAKADVNEHRAELQYQRVQDWTTVFNAASTDEKKMILAQMIERVEVDSSYRINIYMKISENDFMKGT